MDLNLSEELQLIQSTVRRFVTEQLAPLEREHADRPLPPAVRADLIGRVRDLGLWAPAAPAELGGGGLDYVGHAVILEEAGRTILDGCNVARTLFGGNPPEPLLAASGSILQNVVQPYVNGEAGIAFVAPSPAGPAPVQGVRDGDGWSLTGTLSGVEGLTDADWLLTSFTTTEGEAFAVVNLDSAGVMASAPFGILTDQGTVVATVTLTGCHLPATQVVGAIGEGTALRLRWAAGESLRLASRLLGLVERGARMARDYAKQRVTFGQPLSNRQAIQWKLVDAEMDINASRWILRHALWSADQGELDAALATKVRLYVVPSLWRSIDEVLQVYGGIGFTQDMPIEAMWRHVRMQLDRQGSLGSAKQFLAESLVG